MADRGRRGGRAGHVATRRLDKAATIEPIEVGIRELRADLSRWVRRVRDGEEIVVTDRGTAVARLVPMNGESAFDRLVREGIIIPAPNTGPRTRAKPIEGIGPLGDFVLEGRR